MTDRLVVFDWDGTLIDSVGTIVECTRESFRRLGLATPAAESVRGAIGLGLRESVERFFPGTDDELFRRVVETYRELWFDHFTELSELFPGVQPMLQELRGLGYRLAVATAKGRRGLDRELRRTELGPLFDVSRTADEAPPKPDPQMLLELMQQAGCGPEATLMVGDTVWDLEMARNAGVTSVAVCTGAHSRERLLAAEPATCLDEVAELPSWLASSCG